MGYEQLSTVIVLIIVLIGVVVWLPIRTSNSMRHVEEHRDDRYSTSLHLVDEHSGTRFSDDTTFAKGVQMQPSERRANTLTPERIAEVRRLRHAAVRRRQMIVAALLVITVVVLVLAVTLHFSTLFALIPAALTAVVLALGAHAASQARAWERKVAEAKAHERKSKAIKAKARKAQVEQAKTRVRHEVEADSDAPTDEMTGIEIRRALRQAQIEQKRALAERARKAAEAQARAAAAQARAQAEALARAQAAAQAEAARQAQLQAQQAAAAAAAQAAAQAQQAAAAVAPDASVAPESTQSQPMRTVRPAEPVSAEQSVAIQQAPAAQPVVAQPVQPVQPTQPVQPVQNVRPIQPAAPVQVGAPVMVAPQQAISGATGAPVIAPRKAQVDVASDHTTELAEVHPARAIDAYDMATAQDLISFSLGEARNVETEVKGPESLEIKSMRQVAKAEPVDAERERELANEAKVETEPAKPATPAAPASSNTAESGVSDAVSGASEASNEADESVAETMASTEPVESDDDAEQKAGMNDVEAFHESEEQAKVAVPAATSDSLGNDLAAILARRGA